MKTLKIGPILWMILGIGLLSTVACSKAIPLKITVPSVCVKENRPVVVEVDEPKQELVIRGESVDNVVDNHIDSLECKERLRRLLGEK